MQERILQNKLTNGVWNAYVGSIPRIGRLFSEQKPALDHYAIVDISPENGGIPIMKRIYEMMGYRHIGTGYLPEKYNDFVWMRATDFEESLPSHSQPQPILADFRIDLLTPKARSIVEKFLRQNQSFDFSSFERKIKDYKAGNDTLADEIVSQAMDYMVSKPWQNITRKDYLTLAEENQLLAWALLCGRKANHFGVGIYNLNFTSLNEFNKYAHQNHNLAFNTEGGWIKGGAQVGIEQSSTIGDVMNVDFEDGVHQIHDSFMEFVWRFPVEDNPTQMKHYYCDFVPVNANKVIESIYDHRQN